MLISESPGHGSWLGIIAAAALIAFSAWLAWLDAGGAWAFQKRFFLPALPVVAAAVYIYFFYLDFVESRLKTDVWGPRRIASRINLASLQNAPGTTPRTRLAALRQPFSNLA
jgi:hypothetical protein